MRKKSLLSRIGSTLLAGLTALSVVTTSIGNVMTVEAASGAKLATTEQIVGRAASLLGTKYAFGAKGGTAYTSGSIYSPWASTRSYGIDCSGLVWWTLTSLGYSTSGYSYNNPVPVDTPNWLYPGSSTAKYVTRGGGTSRITYEKEGISTDTRPYYQINASKNIRPGSVVVAENPYGTDHAWIYIGEFDNETQVENYVINALKVGGAANYSNYMSESYIRSKITATNGNCRHWRIESNGSEGVVINNGEDGKTSGAVRITTFPMTPDEATFTINKYDELTGNRVGTSPIINAYNKNAVYGIYNNSSCTGTPVGTITIGANGSGSATLSYATNYWAKEIKAPTGYLISNKVYKVYPNSSTDVTEEENRSGSIIINKQAEDGLSVANRKFRVQYSEKGENKKIDLSTDASGKCTFTDLPVYDIGGTNTAIEFTVSEILTTTEQQTIIQPAAQKVKLNALAAQDFTTTLTFVNKKYGDAVLNKVFLDNDGERIATASEVATLRNQCSFGIVNSDGVHIAVLYNAGEPVETAVTELDDRGRAVAKFTKLKLFGVSGADIYFNDYTITETEAPENYNLSGNVFETKAYTRSVYNSGIWAPTDSAEPLTLTFNDYEDWQTATVSAFKADNYTDENGENEFLPGAEFTLSAAEDITKPDGTIIYNNGDVIETAVSGENGEAAFTTKLPVGFRYTITETKAPVNHTLSSDNSQTILLAWDSEKTDGISFPNYTADFFNDYQSGSVSVFKIDKDDNTKYLSGAEFTLYAGEDINVSGYKYAKDEAIDVISTEVTDENTTGTVKFTKDVPVGFEYYIVETKAPEGYKLDDETKHTFALEYDASLEHVETQISVEDESIDVDFAKIDVNGDEIEGAEVQVLKKETVNKAESEADEPILVDEWIEYDSWTSTDETHRITTMPALAYALADLRAIEDFREASKSVDETAERGTITLHKVGSFYEVYDDDAKRVANILGLHLLKRGERDMVGFPDHALENYRETLKVLGSIIIEENYNEEILNSSEDLRREILSGTGFQNGKQRIHMSPYFHIIKLCGLTERILVLNFQRFF